MKILLMPFLAIAAICLTSCGSGEISLAELSGPEQDLLATINRQRVSQGKKALVPSASLTELARKDAARRVGKGEGYIDHRQATGYERMLTLAGRAKAGDQFGNQLMRVWQRHPLQREWLNGNYSGVGVGTATEASGMQTGVLLLGGFSGGGI